MRASSECAGHAGGYCEQADGKRQRSPEHRSEHEKKKQPHQRKDPHFGVLRISFRHDREIVVERQCAERGHFQRIGMHFGA